MDFDSAFAAINQFGGVDYAPHNKGVTPVFFIEPILDPAATEREGHTVYRDMERVRIHIAGDPLSAATHPVDEGIKARFREQYDTWKLRKSGAHINGVPLSKWPMATPGMIKELEFLNIFSVEDLAGVSDGNAQNIRDGRAIRAKAIAWLASAKDGAAVMRYAAEVERLMNRVAELEKLGGVPEEKQITPPPPRKAAKRAKKWKWSAEQRANHAAAIKVRHAMKANLEIETAVYGTAPSDAVAASHVEA